MGTQRERLLQTSDSKNILNSDLYLIRAYLCLQ